MGERKGQNKYYPPDFDPSKGSLNSWLGTHPLRDRARKLHKGILVIRFEMPYNIWCDGCNNHIGMGVRYNAEKSKVGNYYTTPIYKFRMKCHLCNNYFEIQTDPKNHDYVILEGARRKEQRWDPRANEQIVPEDKATQKKLATDPMYKLEHGSDDKQRGKVTLMSVAQIEGMRDSWNDDYTLNKLARDKFRGEKKQIASAKAADQALLDKSSLDIQLVPEAEEDHKMAGLLKYSVTKSYDEKQQEKRRAIGNRPLFSCTSATATSSSVAVLVIPKSKDSTFSHRTEIKRKLGLHLTSPRVEHTIGLPSSSCSSVSFAHKGLVKIVAKRKPSGNDNVSSELESSSNSSSSNGIVDTSRTMSGHEDEKGHDENLSSEKQRTDDTGEQKVYKGDSKNKTSEDTAAEQENYASDSKETLRQESGKLSTAITVSKISTPCDLTVNFNDDKTGLAALIASYSDSESGNSDAAEQI